MVTNELYDISLRCCAIWSGIDLNRNINACLAAACSWGIVIVLPICRNGGDEFIVVTPEMKKEDAVMRSEKWCEMLRQTQFENEWKEIVVTISIGIAVFPNGGVDADALMVSTDRTLYQAKEAGQDCVRMF